MKFKSDLEIKEFVYREYQLDALTKGEIPYTLDEFLEEELDWLVRVIRKVGEDEEKYIGI